MLFQIIRKYLSKTWVLLFIFLIIGFIFRSYKLSAFPVGIHIDEAQIGYNAYSLFKTGFDETGKFLPTHLTLWGIDRPLAISYISIPGIMLFGLNEFGTRIDSVILGTLTILLIFFLTEQIFGKRSISLLSTLLFAISPWHIILSRATSEAIGSLFFYLLGTLLCWRMYKKDSNIFIIFLYISFIISFFFYHSIRITIPFLFLFFAILSWRNKKKVAKSFLVLIIVYIIFPLIPFSITSVERFKQVSVFNNNETKLLLEEQYREDGQSSIITSRVFHNKIVNYSLKLTNNFLHYFTYDFLIFKGGFPIRYIVPDMGVIYFIELPFVILGIFSLFKSNLKQNRSSIIFIFLWIFLGAFSATLTVEETPNINRALFILPALQWFTAIGIIKLFQNINTFRFIKPLIFLFFILFFSWNIGYFIHQYTTHSITHRPWYRFSEMKDLVQFMNINQNKYKKVVLSFNSTEPYIFFLFYNKVDPNKYQKLIKTKGLEYAWNNIGPIEIARQDCPEISKEDQPYTLVVLKSTCKLPIGSRRLKNFTYPDNETSLVAVDFP